MESTTPFTQLNGHQYISLTTFRKNGQPMATPVWFAIDGDRIYIVTPDNSGKVKRIRNNPSVTMAPSDGRGAVVPGAPLAQGLATIVPMENGGRGDRALRAKYGLLYSVFSWIWRLRRTTAVILEVRPA